MSKIYTSAIIGCGNRGWGFGRRMLEKSSRFVSL